MTKYSRFPNQPRPDGGWLYGQLTQAEVEFFCQLAKGRKKPLVLAGSLAETDLGLRRRYTKLLAGFLSDFRREKPESEMIDTVLAGKEPVVRDIDFWEESKLDDEEIEVIRNFFINQNPHAFVETTVKKLTGMVDKGYKNEHYPTLDSFGKHGGALVFFPDGETIARIAGAWHLAGSQGPSSRETAVRARITITTS